MGKAKQDLTRNQYSVTDGQRTIGVIVQVGRRFTAVSATAGHVGVFSSVKLAMCAISRAHRTAHGGGGHA
jgi:hypothetical protein